VTMSRPRNDFMNLCNVRTSGDVSLHECKSRV
jgi:hypothetical protein